MALTEQQQSEYDRALLGQKQLFANSAVNLAEQCRSILAAFNSLILAYYQKQYGPGTAHEITDADLTSLGIKADDLVALIVAAQEIVTEASDPSKQWINKIAKVAPSRIE